MVRNHQVKSILQYEVFIMTKDTLFDESRFFLSRGNNTYFLYDSRTGDYYLEESLIGIVNRLKELKDLKEPRVIFSEARTKVFKLNMSTVCNMNCLYCFRDKKKTTVTDVGKAIKIIDAVFDDFAPDLSDYSFVLNMTSESTVEFEKIKRIKAYLEKRTSPFFDMNDFKSVLIARDLVSGIPCELTGDEKNLVTKEEIVKFLNAVIKRLDFSEFFPIPEGMIIPEWEAERYRNVKNLSEKELVLFNRRFLELLFPDIVKRRPGFSLFVCTNGTNYSDEIVKFFDDLNMDTVCISLDGPSGVHNKFRRFNDESATHELIVGNILKFQNAGKKISISSVITPDFPYPLRLLEYFKSLGVSSVDMKPVRAGTEFSFTKKDMEKLLEGYKSLFERLKTDILKGDYSLLDMLGSDITTSGLKLLISKERVIKRCRWDEETVIDSKGDVYPCDYMMGKPDFVRGNIFKKDVVQNTDENLFVDNRKGCSTCWNRYLCGGTCYFNSYTVNGNIYAIDEVECMFMKGLRTLQLEFIHGLMENGISILVIAKRLGINVGDDLALDKTYFISNGIEKSLKGTLTRLEIEINKMYNYLDSKNIKCKKEMFLSIDSVDKIEQKQENSILNVRVILPTEDYDCLLDKYKCIKNYSLKNCISGKTLSNEQSVNKLKQRIYEPVKALRIPLSSSFWYKGSVNALFGHSTNEEIECFVQKSF